jgi:hypothetical protein
MANPSSELIDTNARPTLPAAFKVGMITLILAKFSFPNFSQGTPGSAKFKNVAKRTAFQRSFWVHFPEPCTGAIRFPSIARQSG